MTSEAAEVKIRMLAAANATLAAMLGTSPFRWFDVQSAQGYEQQGTLCRYRRVSAVYMYAQEGLTQLEQVRFQFDFVAQTPSDSWNAMQAFIEFMAGVDLMSDAQFKSPPTTPTQSPNYLLSTRQSIEYRPERELYIWSCDWRVFNNLNV